jgi:hypothetical protein
MVMATAMANGDGDGNGQRQGQWQQQWLTAMRQRWRRPFFDQDCNGNGQWQWRQRWAIAMATAMAMVTESAMATEMATVMAMATAMARATITKEELPLHVAEICSAFGRQHLASTPMDTKESAFTRALRHGGDTAKNVCSPSRGRVPDSSPWIVFCLFFTTTVQFTEQPSVHPLHY